MTSFYHRVLVFCASLLFIPFSAAYAKQFEALENDYLSGLYEYSRFRFEPFVDYINATKPFYNTPKLTTCYSKEGGEGVEAEFIFHESGTVDGYPSISVSSKNIYLNSKISMEIHRRRENYFYKDSDGDLGLSNRYFFSTSHGGGLEHDYVTEEEFSAESHDEVFRANSAIRSVGLSRLSNSSDFRSMIAQVRVVRYYSYVTTNFWGNEVVRTDGTLPEINYYCRIAMPPKEAP